MTDKRFTVTAYEFYDNGEPILGEDVCELLNELHEENKQLKLLNNYLTELLKDLNGVSIEIEKVMWND